MDSADFCPYVGLDPYTERERPYFFGREQDTRVVVANLHASALTIFFGPSGVGKSSVLLAGVVPMVREKPRGAIVVFRDWQGDEFHDALKEACCREAESRVADGPSLDRGAPLDDVLGAAVERVKGPVFVVLDQFEEYFVSHPTMVTDFESEFARAVNREDVDAHFVVSLREDALSLLERFQPRIANLLGNMLRIRHLDRAGAKAAIEKPLGVYGQEVFGDERAITIDDKLVNAVLDQVPAETVERAADGSAIETAFLQLVMERLWAEDHTATSRKMTWKTFDDLGGAKAIVESHVGDLMNKLGSRAQELCSRFFDRLISPAIRMKVPCTVADVLGWTSGDASEAEVRALLETLAKNRILRPVPIKTGGVSILTYQVAHDMLGLALLGWRARYLSDRSAREAASEAAKDAEAKVVLRTREQAKRRRRLVLAVAAALGMIGFAFYVKINERRTREARSQAKEASHQARVASSRMLASRALIRLAENPESAALFAIEAELINPTIEAEDALRTALRELRALRTFQADEGSVFDVRFDDDASHVITASDTHRLRSFDLRTGAFVTREGLLDDDVLSLAPNVREAITAGPGGGVRLWMFDERPPVVMVPPGLSASAISTSRTHVIVAREGHLELWRVADRTKLTQVSVGRAAGGDGPLDNVAIDAAGTRFAAARVVNEARLIRVCAATGKRCFDVTMTCKGPSSCVGPLAALALSPDGDFLAAADWSRVVLWHLGTTRAEESTEIAHDGLVNTIQFSDDSTMLATASDDNTAQIVAVTDPARRTQLRGHLGPVNAVALTHDSPPSYAATASGDGTVRIWPLGDLAAPIVLRGHTSPVRSVRFSQDGRQLVSGSEDGTARTWRVMGPDVVGVPSSAHFRSLSIGGGIASFVGAGLRSGVVRSIDGSTVWHEVEDRPSPKNRRALGLIALAPGGRFFLHRGYERTSVYEVGHLEPIGTFPTFRVGTLATKAIAIDAKGSLLVIGFSTFQLPGRACEDCTSELRFLTLPTGLQRGTGVALPSAPREIGFLPDGTVVTRLEDKTVQLIAMDATGSPDRSSALPSRRFGENVTRMALALDAPRIAIASSDGDISVVEWRGERAGIVPEIFRARADAAVLSLALSPDGHWIAAALENGNIAVWDLSGRGAAKIVRFNALTVTFTPDGRRLMAMTPTQLVDLGPLDSQALVAKACTQGLRTPSDLSKFYEGVDASLLKSPCDSGLLGSPPRSS